MRKCLLPTLAALAVLLGPVDYGLCQQFFPVPDRRSLTHITTRTSDHAPDIPGKETTMDFYSGPDGQVVTIYSFNGRNVAFSTHRNSDIQGSYRLFMDLSGDGRFQEVNRSATWQLPAWVRSFR